MDMTTEKSEIGNDPLSKKALSDFINVVLKIKDIKGREYRMGNLTELLEVARKLNSYCKTIDELTVSCQSDYENEEFVVNQEVTRMKSDMQTKYQNFQYRYFTAIRENIDRLIDILKDDYNVSGVNAQNGVFGSFSENEKLLSQYLQKINDLIEKLNRTDFYSLVPPAKVEIDGESFTVTRGNNTQTYNCDSSKMTRVNDPKPLETTVMELYRYCALAKECVAMLMRQHEKEFDIPAFEAHVDAAANQWLRDKKNALDKKYKDTFNELFVDTNKKAVPQSFFDAIEQDAQKTRINPEVGATTYNEVVNIGDLGLVVESDPTHLGYFANSPVLRKNMRDGKMRSPLLLDLKKAGNILLNVNGNTYSDDVIDFVNQLILRFLLSFPASRINFCLVDIDNMIGFSQFTKLTKINPEILLKGIVRDDRQLENTIKDMEQRMYSIDDNILSFNNVSDIFEYNRKYEANPQNVYLFVLVNYPSGMREDIAKKILKIISNGNRAGIFSVIVNNSACPLPPGYKQVEYAQFIETVKKFSLTIDYTKKLVSSTIEHNSLSQYVDEQNEDDEGYEEYYEIACPCCGETICFDGESTPKNIRCPACGEKIDYIIEDDDSHSQRISVDPNKCFGCMLCARNCPTSAIAKTNYIAPSHKLPSVKIEKDRCIECEKCIEVCKFGAISMPKKDVTSKSQKEGFTECVKQTSLQTDSTGSKNVFYVNGIPYRNELLLRDDVTVAHISKIVKTLCDDVETNKQKVIPLSAMFDATDAQINEKGSKALSAAAVLDIPIGLRGSEVQNILLKTTTDGDAHAVLIGGTGSGKSNLLHTIIMNACYKYSPMELNLYLVDFKGGVEFKYYEANKNVKMQLPHIKLTGLTSDVEDGVSILHNLHKELRRREDEFRRSGVEDIMHYNNTGKQIPRLLVIIDEIQELFEQDLDLGQKAIDILREFMKKGRALGINILWASQNIPSGVAGLKDKILSQIGNKICLRLNDPENARELDETDNTLPSKVKALNRPEKGLGIIKDIRHRDGGVEFRIAYAESSENRRAYSQIIIDKWEEVTKSSIQEPLFIVGDDNIPSPIEGRTFYTKRISNIATVNEYEYQLGQDYITGKPFCIGLGMRLDKANILMTGYDLEVLRDMMGYALLSTVMNQLSNKNYYSDPLRIYYANGEMISDANENDLYNVVRNDFSPIIENVSSNRKMTECIQSVYRLYRNRYEESDELEREKTYTPCFVIIHSLQRFIDLFSNNPMLTLSDDLEDETERNDFNVNEQRITADMANAFAMAHQEYSDIGETTRDNGTQSVIPFASAFSELLLRGGRYGIHFVMSVDNPLAISQIREALSETECKIFTKGTGNIAAQMLDNYRIANSLNNSKIAVVAVHNECAKMRLYRYEHTVDNQWYRDIVNNYKALWENNR